MGLSSVGITSASTTREPANLPSRQTNQLDSRHRVQATEKVNLLLLTLDRQYRLLDGKIRAAAMWRVVTGSRGDGSGGPVDCSPIHEGIRAANRKHYVAKTGTPACSEMIFVRVFSIPDNKPRLLRT